MGQWPNRWCCCGFCMLCACVYCPSPLGHLRRPGTQRISCPVFKVSRAEGQGDAVLSGRAGDDSVVAVYLPRAASFLQNSGFPIWGASRGRKSSLTIRLTSDSSTGQLLGQGPAQNQQVTRHRPMDVARARALLIPVGGSGASAGRQAKLSRLSGAWLRP